MTQKHHTFQPGERLLSCEREQVSLHRNATHHRQMISGLKDLQDGCAAGRCISPHTAGQQVETRFIHENQHTAFQTGFFLRSSQVWVCQVAMAGSSRWLARSMGFWGVQFNSLRIRAYMGFVVSHVEFSLDDLANPSTCPHRSEKAIRFGTM